jgi:hypothetical protein
MITVIFPENASVPSREDRHHARRRSLRRPV